MLRSQLYGQGDDLIAELTNEQLKWENGVKFIVDAVYQRDFLFFISEAFDGFNAIMNTRRASNESLRNFKLRFSAAVTKFKSLFNVTKLPRCITALMLLSNARVEHSQRISALAAAAPNGPVFTDQSSIYDYLSAMTYKQSPSVVKQCEKAMSTNDQLRLLGNAAGTANFGEHGRRTGYKRPSNSVLKRHPCHTCGKFGHWKDSHSHGGSLKSDDKSKDTATELTASTYSKCRSLSSSSSFLPSNNSILGKKKRALSNKAVLIGNSCSTKQASMCLVDKTIGPLLDEGKPYSALRNVERRLLFDDIGYRGDHNIVHPHAIEKKCTI